MNKYNLLVDFRTQGYNIQGNILRVFLEILKMRKSGAKFEIYRLSSN